MSKLESSLPDNSQSQAQINAEFAEITGAKSNLADWEDSLYARLIHPQTGPRDYVLAQTPDFDFIDDVFELQSSFPNPNTALNPLSRRRLRYLRTKLICFFIALIPIGLFWLGYALTDFQDERIPLTLPAACLLTWYFAISLYLLYERQKLKETEVKYAFLSESEKEYSTSAIEFDDGARL